MRDVSELIFYAGTMDCGKSTLALQTDHNHASRGRAGVVFTRLDRAGDSVLSSRLGLQVPAVEVELIQRSDIDPVGAGEAAHGPVTAAIANAVFDALGVRVRKLPFTRDTLIAAMEEGA